MKALKLIIWGILFFLGVFYILPVGLLRIPYIQEKISQKASEVLEEKLGVETQIGHVDFELFNKLILKDLYLEDLSGDTLFQAKRLAVGFEFTPLLKGKLRFGTAQLFSFQVNFNKETADAPLNFQFILDALASQDTTKKNKNIDIRINTLHLRRGNFTFRVKDAGKTPGKLNPKDINIKDLSAKIHINNFTNKLLIADFSKFSFKEQSGLDIQRLSFNLSASDSKAKITHLQLKLPNSLLYLKDITADYSLIKRPEDYVNQTLVDLTIRPSSFALKDLSPFIPAFSNFRDKVVLEGVLSGNLNDLELKNLVLQDEDRLMIKAKTKLKSLTTPGNMYISGEVEQSYISSESIRRMVHNFSSSEVELPSQIAQLGDIRFEGEISGFLHHLSAYGIFHTDIGTIRTDINVGKEDYLFINGTIQTNGLDFKKLMHNEDYGNTSFNILVDARQGKNNQFSGRVDATVGRFEYKGYSYENLSMKGDFTPTGFSGHFDVDSPEGKLSAKGLFVLKGKDSEFNFSAEAEHIQLDRLNLSRKYKNSDLSFNIKADFSGNNIDNLLGSINLTDVRFNTERGGYYLDSLDIQATQLNTEKILTIHSDIVNGEIRGLYSFRGIVPTINHTLSGFLPAFFSDTEKIASENANNFSINFTIEDTQEFSYIMDLPFVLYNKTNVVGQYNSIYNKFRIEAYSPRIKYKNSVFESSQVLLENPDNHARVQLSSTSLQKNNKKLTFYLNSAAANNAVETSLEWNDNQAQNYSGILSFNTFFTKQDKQSSLQTTIEIQENQLMINDSIWKIHPASIAIDPEKIRVNGLKIDHDDQYLIINGTVSHNPDDYLRIDLNKVDLEYVFNTLNIPALEFGGIASGYVTAQDLYATRKLSTNLDVDHFGFNNTTFGNLTLKGIWDEKEQGILMSGLIFKDDTTKVDVDGIIYPVKEELSIVFDAQNTDASFLRKYMKNVAKDISGKLNGKLRLFGDLNDPTVEGDVFVKNGSFGIEFLNTYYTFTDTVKCRPDEIIFKNINLHDKNGWAALVKSGSVKHKLFSDFTYSAEIVFDNFLVYNATEKHNPYFYGTVYGTGSANIWGSEKTVNIDVTMQNTKNTKLNLNFMEESDITNYDFIHFVDKKRDTTSLVEKYVSQISDKPIYLKTNSETDIRFNLNLDATPDALVELIMDPATDDKIRANGSGHLQVQYGTRTPLKMVGNYTLDRGKYNFSFQQVLFRDFDISEGSSVSFRGDPYAANLNINAVYSTMANLNDLNPALVDYAGRTSVMVNCILNITGAMEHPNIKFNIEIPESEYLERQVKNYINTEDMMSRQMVYLLVLNRFYTPAEDNLNGGRLPMNDFSALASSTLSSSLSSIVNSFTENVQLGTRIRTGNTDAMTGTEVELVLSSQLLDNRLIINGNLGYRDYSHLVDDNKGLPPFVGDFDLEYKLTPGGGIRLKAYNHYNYKYYYDTRGAKTTQGLGIIFRKDFDSLNELFRRKRFQLPLPPLDSVPNNPDHFIKFKK